MSKESDAMLMMVKGTIFDLPKEQQDRIVETKKRIEAIISEEEGLGLIALAWIGAERAAEDE